MTSTPLPRVRPRRLRETPALRRLVSETRLHSSELVLPLFVREGVTAPVPIGSMPGVVQHSLESLPAAIDEAAAAGVGGVMLFGVPEVRDARGSGATDPDGILNVATRIAAAEVGDALVVQTDLCLDEFTDHGHCGVLDAAGRVDNDASLDRYRSMALAQASAGSALLGLSGMMDGQVRAVREVLDANGHQDAAILGYAAKYASALYGPFREAVQSSLEGDRRTYQLDPATRDSTSRYSDAGLTMTMSAPSSVPVWAYQVSGEYSMIEAAAANGWIDRERAVLESLVSIRRAGADAILTYWAVEAAQLLREGDRA